MLPDKVESYFDSFAKKAAAFFKMSRSIKRRWFSFLSCFTSASRSFWEHDSAGASDYPELAKKGIIEMNRQVGELLVNKRRIALQGLIIRHLVMPNRVAGTEKFVKWVVEALPKSTYVNIMPQYHVEYKAYDYPEIARGITVKEFLEAMEWADKYGLTNLDPKSVAVRDIYSRRGSS